MLARDAVTRRMTFGIFFPQVYHRLAIYLTTIENPRTQTEYEDSYTFKIFVFEFMNYYSSLIYIAFFKGRFYDYPGDDGARKNEFFKLKGDICDPAGCLSELCIQVSASAFITSPNNERIPLPHHSSYQSSWLANRLWITSWNIYIRESIYSRPETDANMQGFLYFSFHPVRSTTGGASGSTNEKQRMKVICIW